MAEQIPDSPRSDDDASTRLPLLRSWRAVYAFVVGTFVLWVTLLTMLARAFS